VHLLHFYKIDELEKTIWKDKVQFEKKKKELYWVHVLAICLPITSAKLESSRPH
jgi:hypothetical protein